ncbi:hypothetical protein D4L85_26980 [Chryseolinea soli]|uniref:Uncharacterized protein n=2 Tax=Chryseolinea soli TaxID=2321403 RepID=A0A385SS23_9BACT|nr:hypothetical protein D4L85_26980 [Chryseolinea soli]
MRIEVMGARRAAVAHYQQALGYQLHTQGFAQELESLLNQITSGDEYVEIPQLKIQFDTSGEKVFQKEFLQAFGKALQEKIKTSSGSAVKVMKGAAFIDYVQQFFLQYGICPLQHGKPVLAEFQQTLKALPTNPQPKLERVIMTLGRRNTTLWKRLSYLLGAEGMRSVLKRLRDANKKEFHGLEGLSQTDDPVLQKILREPEFAPYIPEEGGITPPTSVDAIPSQPHTGTVALTAGKTAAKENAPPQRVRRAALSTPDFEAEVRSGFQIANAGTVLLWAVFGQLLQTTGYVVNKQFTDDNARQRAIWLLHYITTGNLEGSEDNLLLNKVLCAWPENEPVDPTLLPGDVDRIAADQMLHRYLAHWKKGRTFSPGWFRATFLNREGRLYKRPDGHWQLEVDKRTEDILIDKVSVVRYAWMPCLLFVQW